MSNLECAVYSIIPSLFPDTELITLSGTMTLVPERHYIRSLWHPVFFQSYNAPNIHLGSDINSVSDYSKQCVFLCQVEGHSQLDIWFLHQILV